MIDDIKTVIGQLDIDIINTMIAEWKDINVLEVEVYADYNMHRQRRVGWYVVGETIHGEPKGKSLDVTLGKLKEKSVLFNVLGWHLYTSVIVKFTNDMLNDCISGRSKWPEPATFDED